MPSVPRYEEEVALRATAENEFVALKKVSDSVILQPELTRGSFAGPWRPVLPRVTKTNPCMALDLSAPCQPHSGHCYLMLISLGF